MMKGARGIEFIRCLGLVIFLEHIRLYSQNMCQFLNDYSCDHSSWYAADGGN